jgi:hypothetical protein
MPQIVDMIACEMTRWISVVTPGNIMAFIALIIAIISCGISLKNYTKSQRLEFLQRRDQLFLKIADLNAKNSEGHQIAARFGIVALNANSMPVMDEEHAERNKTLVASMKALAEKIDLGANQSGLLNKRLHSLCSNLTPTTDRALVENLIVLVQEASNEAKQCNEIYLSSLYTLETTDPIMRASVAKVQELKKRQAEIDLENAMKELNDKSPR